MLVNLEDLRTIALVEAIVYITPHIKRIIDIQKTRTMSLETTFKIQEVTILLQ